VEIEINNPNQELRAGMYGTAKFVGNNVADVLVIPRTAFVGSVSDNRVFVADRDKVVAHAVVACRNVGDYIEVISGLESGDQVIISGQINLIDQTPITIIK